MNEQCKSCVHKDVCAYKAHYKHAIEIYEKTKNECGEYPYFVCDIRCIKYCKELRCQEIRGRKNDER